LAQNKALTVYCHHADVKSLKRFFKKNKFKATVIAHEFVERGTCLCAFEVPPRPRRLFPTLHQEDGVQIVIPHFYNRSTLYENCNVQILEDTETEDISIGFFREIEG